MSTPVEQALRDAITALETLCVRGDLDDADSATTRGSIKRWKAALESSPPLAERVQAALTDEVLSRVAEAYDKSPWLASDPKTFADMRAVLLAALAPTTPQE